MHRKQLLHQLETYFASSFITAEELSFYDKFIEFIQANPLCFERTNTGHITASAWILNHDLTKALLTHHKKLDIWCQLGGHCDGETDTLAVALKEAEEESGIETFSLLIPEIFDIDIHPIPGTCAYHYDIRYLLQVPEDTLYTVSDESHDLAWIPLNKIQEYTQERSVLRMKEKCDRYFFS